MFKKNIMIKYWRSGWALYIMFAHSLTKSISILMNIIRSKIQPLLKRYKKIDISLAFVFKC